MKGISFGIVTLLCFVLLASLQSTEPWKPLFKGTKTSRLDLNAFSGSEKSHAHAHFNCFALSLVGTVYDQLARPEIIRLVRFGRAPARAVWTNFADQLISQ